MRLQIQTHAHTRVHLFTGAECDGALLAVWHGNMKDIKAKDNRNGKETYDNDKDQDLDGTVHKMPHECNATRAQCTHVTAYKQICKHAHI